MIKNGIYFIVITLLVAELFKILVYANWMTCDITLWTKKDVKSQKMEYILRLFLYRTETLYFYCDISMATQWAPSPLHSKDKIRVFSFKKCYLVVLFIQWV